MKSDFSRSTFNPAKHFRSVRMQQGRVQVDADWNEQLDIGEHRETNLVSDAIGKTGVPDGNGFLLDVTGDGSDLIIGAGRIYVGGILCENDASLTFTGQAPADFPGASSIQQALETAEASFGLVYMDVWPREISYLEDDSIREKALGGPDTATRVKNIWQVKVFPLAAEQTALAPLQALLMKEAALEAELASLNRADKGLTGGQLANTGTIRRTPEFTPSDDSLTQQLSAVAGQIDDLIGTLTFGDPASMSVADAGWTSLIAPADTSLTARLSPSGIAASACELLPQSGYQRLENQLYRVEVHDAGNATTATFKWSRENGSVVVRWLSQDNLRLTVSSTGRGAPLNFNSGDWVELFDDTNELSGTPGQFVQVGTVEGSVLVLQPPPVGVTVDMTKFPRNPRIRRWDQTSSTGPVSIVPVAGGDSFIPIEGGIEVQFAGTTFRTGDYWWIPARTALSDTQVGGIEWPEDALGNPLAQPPAGIAHSFTELGLVYSDGAGHLQVLADYREIFPSLTELNQLFYVGGDAQAGSPGQAVSQPLQVGVSRGQNPVADALVQFTVISGDGALVSVSDATKTGDSLVIRTGADGVAPVTWQLGSIDEAQRVEAVLLGPGLNPLHLPIYFTASFAGAPGGQLRITDLRMFSGYALRNASHVLNTELLQGFQVFCNQPVSQASIESTLTCGLFLYMPYPISSTTLSVNRAVVASPVGSSQERAETAKPETAHLAEIAPIEGVEKLAGTSPTLSIAPPTGEQLVSTVTNPGLLVNPLGNPTSVAGIGVVSDPKGPAAPSAPSQQTVQPQVAGVVLPFWGYQPFLLIGSVDVDPNNPSVFNWRPGSGYVSQLLYYIFAELANYQVTSLPVELRIRGNFILAQNAPNWPMSADVFNTPNGMQLPTGDLRPGGDLQFFFTMVQTRPAYNPAPIFRIDALDQVAAGIGTQLI